jgi:muramoyltetrapeptide carboxypeptidase
MSKKSWSFLSPDDTVEIIAPASHSPLNKFDDGIKWVEQAGLKPHVPHDIVKTDLFFAAPLEVQLKHLKDALKSDAKAIWCLRGGYGSMRLIPHLLKMHPPKKPKLFIGFSDITALHLFFIQKWNWPVIHGRTISQMNPEHAGSPDRKLLTDVIFGKETNHTFKKLIPLNSAAKTQKEISGTITGGNLRILQSSLGTSWELNAKGKILFIEDVAERGYSVDRMLEQLFQAKIIDKGLKALVFGDFTEGQEKDGKDLTLDAMERFAKRVSYPVLRGLPAGHGHELNYPVPFNTKCTLKLGRSAELSCSYGGSHEFRSRKKKH